MQAWHCHRDRSGGNWLGATLTLVTWVPLVEVGREVVRLNLRERQGVLWPGDRQIACSVAASTGRAALRALHQWCGRGRQEGGPMEPSRATVRPLNRQGLMAARLHPCFARLWAHTIGSPLALAGAPSGEYGLSVQSWLRPGGPEGGRESKSTTLSGGSLGSCIDEERSQLR